MSKSLWVVNTSGNNLSIDTQNTQGNTKTLSVKKTWVPQDLSLQGRPDDITSSPDYRRAIVKGLIAEKDEADVKRLFDTDKDAKEESDRILNINSASLLTNKQEQTIVDPAAESTPEEILVSTVFGRGSEEAVISEIRTMRVANKLNESAVLELAKKANEVGYEKAFKLLNNIAEEM